VLLAGSLIATPAAASVTDDQNSSTPPKQAAANPKKPSTAKSGNDSAKVKTDERMSTRGLKPPPKDADKNPKPDPKSDTAPKQ
jgi:hypothetical protein